eukprot:TRINITY_DN18_c0_g1_i1.p1 TRINITY_DN18_c0_g1~~TRINITY_DN18_c0_g1_i1.p1  ORF type:complete len:323 (+),score=84.18 TRINITY_DN18_c0_g1_i1:191-1159(+)
MALTASCSKAVPSMMLDAPLQSSMTGSRISARPLSTSLGVSRSIAANAGRVTAAYAPVKTTREKELEAKSIGELRTIARSFGARGDTKKELVALIIKAQGGSTAAASPRATPSVSSYAPVRATTPVSGRPASSSDPFIASLEAKTIGELRQLGRAKGIRGDTKKELIADLAKLQGLTYAPSSRASTPERSVTPPRSVSPYAAAPPAASPAKAADSEARFRTLSKMSILELRMMARERGLRGDNKAELIKLLLSSPETSVKAVPSRSVSPSSYVATPSASSSSVAAKAKQLERKTLGELRALGRQKGVRGDTKKELIKILSQL